MAVDKFGNYIPDEQGNIPGLSGAINNGYRIDSGGGTNNQQAQSQQMPWWQQLGVYGNSVWENRQNAKQDENVRRDTSELQSRIADPQLQYLQELSPYYGDLAKNTMGLLQDKMNMSSLPPDLAQSIGQYYNQAGTKVGTQLSSNNMLRSGVANQANQDQALQEARDKANTLLQQRREGLQQAQSFIGTRPQIGIPKVNYGGAGGGSGGGSGGGMDASGIGSLLASGNLPGFGEGGMFSDLTLPGFGEGGALSNLFNGSKTAAGVGTSAFPLQGGAQAASSIPLSGPPVWGAEAATSAETAATASAATSATRSPFVTGLGKAGGAAIFGGVATKIIGSLYNKWKDKPVYISAEDVDSQTQELKQYFPKTQAALVDLRSKDVFTEEKNLAENLVPIRTMAKVAQGALELNPDAGIDYDAIMAKHMAKGIGGPEALTEFNWEVTEAINPQIKRSDYPAGSNPGDALFKMFNVRAPGVQSKDIDMAITWKVDENDTAKWGITPEQQAIFDRINAS